MTETLVAPAAERGFEAHYFGPLFAAEDRHFWFRARNRLVATLLRQITAHLPAGYRVLEVGCGTGNVLRVLDATCDRGTVVGMDLFVEGLRFARRRTHCALVQGDMHAPPFRTTFDVIGLFDVLEHLSDDARVLRDLHAMLPVGGTLLLTVPAHMSLWSYVDEVGHHHRRYERNELERKLDDAGYTVEYLTLFTASLFPMLWLSRRIAPLLNRRKVRGESGAYEMALGELRIVPVVNDLLAWILAQEARIIAHRKRLWFGTSLLAIARKMERNVEN